MKFAVGSKEYFEQVGFNTEHWRASVDGLQVLCHNEHASILCEMDKVTVYDVQSQTFKDLLAGPEWSAPEEEDTPDKQ